MALINQVKKTMSDVGQRAKEKTDEIGGIARLRAMISDEEQRIISVYRRIGEQYAKLHENDYEPSFAQMMAELLDRRKNIENYNDQILALRGLRRCEKCGAEVPADARFCSTCAAVLPPLPVPAGYVRCTGCGKAVKEDMHFCPYCGRPMEDRSLSSENISDEKEEVFPTSSTEFSGRESSSQGETVLLGTSGVDLPEANPSVPYEASSAVKKTCPNCGAEIDDRFFFCRECGTKLK